jgi:hypothetical protein
MCCLSSQKKSRLVIAFEAFKAHCREKKVTSWPPECLGLEMMLSKSAGNIYISTDEDAPGDPAGPWHTRKMSYRSKRATIALRYLDPFMKHPHSCVPSPLQRGSEPSKETANVLWTYDPTEWSISRTDLEAVMKKRSSTWEPKTVVVSAAAHSIKCHAVTGFRMLMMYLPTRVRYLFSTLHR